VRYGISLANTQLVAVMDGDHTYPASELPKLYQEATRGHDLVIGKRLPEPGAQPKAFQIGNRVLTTFFNILFGTHLTDVLSGMYILRKEALASTLFEMKGFSVEAEIAAHIANTTGRIREVPIRYRKRLGKKKLGKLAGIKIAADTLRLAWRYNPLLLATGTAALMLAPGLAIATWVGYRYIFLGVSHFVWGIIAIVLTAVGFIALLLAMLTIYLKHMELRIMRTIQALRDQLLSQQTPHRAVPQPKELD
jgi:dolichol-phosphate mannosyltransferase